MTDAVLRKRIRQLVVSYKKMSPIPPAIDMIVDEIIKEVDSFIEFRQTPEPTQPQRIPCPDNKEGCLVMHYGQTTTSELGEIRNKLYGILGDGALGNYTTNENGDFVPLDWTGTPNSYFDSTIDDILGAIEQKYTSNTKIIEAIPKQDTHSHMTRNYCLDCAKRDGYNQAIRDFCQTLNLQPKENK